MKRVLFITYYFPPSGGSGVQRGLKMVKYLPETGWDPLVLTVHPDHAAYPDLDPAMLSDVPKGTLVERTRSWDPYTMYARMMGKKKSDVVGVGFLGADHASWKERFARWVRANLFLPDARVGWVRHAVRPVAGGRPIRASTPSCRPARPTRPILQASSWPGKQASRGLPTSGMPGRTRPISICCPPGDGPVAGTKEPATASCAKPMSAWP